MVSGLTVGAWGIRITMSAMFRCSRQLFVSGSGVEKSRVGLQGLGISGGRSRGKTLY